MHPLGNLFERNITLKMGQAPAIHYMPFLFEQIVQKKFDPTNIITHRLPLAQAPEAYSKFHDHEDESIKFVLKLS